MVFSQKDLFVSTEVEISWDGSHFVFLGAIVFHSFIAITTYVGVHGALVDVDVG